jgi:hypothetical protein
VFWVETNSLIYNKRNIKIRGSTLKVKRILRVYSGDDGIARFEDIEMPLGLEPQTVNNISFRQHDPGTIVPFHTMKQRCYAIPLAGEIEISNGNGEARRIGPGDISLHEDVTGQGHAVKVISQESQIFAIITLA